MGNARVGIMTDSWALSESIDSVGQLCWFRPTLGLPPLPRGHGARPGAEASSNATAARVSAASRCWRLAELDWRMARSGATPLNGIGSHVPAAGGAIAVFDGGPETMGSPRFALRAS